MWTKLAAWFPGQGPEGHLGQATGDHDSRSLVPAASPQGMSDSVCTGCSQSPRHSSPHPSTQALHTAAGTSCPGTDPHTAWSCLRAESSKLREGRRRENMGFLPRLMLSSCPLCQHLCPGEKSKMALPLNKDLTVPLLFLPS